MFLKIFSDDQEIATNQKIGICDYLRPISRGYLRGRSRGPSCVAGHHVARADEAGRGAAAAPGAGIRLAQ